MNTQMEKGRGRGATAPGARRISRAALGGITAVILALILLLLWPALLPGRVLLPLDIITQQWPPWQAPGQVDAAHNPLLSDVVSYIYPVKTFAAETLRRGVFPLWNPYVLTGYPFTYNTQAGLFYPLSLLYLALPAPAAVDGMILLQMALGGLFMALFLRQIGLRAMAVLAGAILFLFNGLMVVWLEWQVVHAAMIWLPLLLFCVEKMVAAGARDRGRAAAWGLGAAAALALPWLGGHWNWAIYASLTAAVYLAARLWGVWRAAGGTRPWARALWPAAAIPALGLALSLVAVLPAALYLARSHRAELAFAESLRLGLLNRGVALLVPRFFGDPLTRTWWGVDNFNETTFYVGILALLLALLAVALRRDWHTRFFAAWGLLGLLWALGPLYGMLYVLPIFNGLQPSRAAIQVVFCTAVLAALGLDRLLAREQAAAWGKTAVIAGGALVLVVALYLFVYRGKAAETWSYLAPQLLFFLLWLGAAVLWLWLAGGRRLPPAWLGALAVLLLSADLFWFGYGYNPIRPVAELYPPTATTDFLRGMGEQWRMVTPPQGLAYPPNASLVPRLPNLSGYEPGLPQTLVAYVNAAEGGDAIRFARKLQPLAGLDSPLLDALAVRYVVSSADVWGAAAAAWPRPEIAAWAALPASMERADVPVGLQRVDVPLRGAEDVTLRVLSADGAYEFAHATAVPAADGEWTSFYVEPFPAEWGSAFVFRVEGVGEVGLAAGGQPAMQAFVLARPGLVFEHGKTRVYERARALPRAYFVPRALPAADAEEALALAQQGQEQLAQQVILETMGQAPPRALAYEEGTAVAEIVAVDLNGLALRVESVAGGFLVLADAYYPGWQAAVDGARVPLYRANSVTRAVELGPGAHTVAFAFRPPDFYLGAVVSGVSWLAVGAFWLWWALRGRRRERV